MSMIYNKLLINGVVVAATGLIVVVSMPAAS